MKPSLFHFNPRGTPAVRHGLIRRWFKEMARFGAAGTLALALLETVGRSAAAESPITNSLTAMTVAATAPAATNPVTAMTSATSVVAKPMSSGPAATNDQETTNQLEALDDKYKLAIGDKLSYRVIEDDEDTKSFTVTDSGDVEIPYLGRIPVVGKTCQGLAREIKTQLEKKYYYQATVVIAVDLKTRSQGLVYLVGQIRSPGPQEIPSDETFTLGKAVLRAGGFSDFADERHVKVTRKSEAENAAKQTFEVDVSEIFDKGKIENDLPLQPGDLVYVPERMIRF